MNLHSRLRRSLFSIGVLVIGTVCSLLYEFTAGLEDKNQVVKSVPTAHKVVALTVDDGPHAKTTPELLAVLKAKQVKATFFVLGANAEAHPEIIVQTLSEGHEIACHAFSHQRLNRLTQAEVNGEFDRFESLLQKLAAPSPTFFRPPDGAYNDALVALARQRGYITVLWSVDAGDWRQPPVDTVVQNVLKQVKPGAIILMHDGQYPLPTAQAAAIIIDKLQSQGYQFLTMSDLMRYYEERE